MKYTIEMEKAETQDASFLDCFKGSNLRRIEIVSVPLHHIKGAYQPLHKFRS